MSSLPLSYSSALYVGNALGSSTANPTLLFCVLMSLSLPLANADDSGFAENKSDTGDSFWSSSTSLCSTTLPALSSSELSLSSLCDVTSSVLDLRCLLSSDKRDPLFSLSSAIESRTFGKLKLDDESICASSSGGISSSFQVASRTLPGVSSKKSSFGTSFRRNLWPTCPWSCEVGALTSLTSDLSSCSVFSALEDTSFSSCSFFSDVIETSVLAVSLSFSLTLPGITIESGKIRSTLWDL